MLLLCLLRGTLHQQSRPIPPPSQFAEEVARGNKDRLAGHVQSAYTHFHLAAQIAMHNHDVKLEGRATLYASGMEIRLFQYRNALQSAKLARQLALTVRDYTGAGAAVSNMATIYSQLGIKVLAERSALEAVHLLQNQTERQDYLVLAWINAGDCQGELHGASAVASLQSAVQVAREAGLKAEEALALAHLGQMLLDRGDIKDAGTPLEEARVLQTQLQDEGLAVTEWSLAQVSLKQGNFQEALRLLNRALQMGGTSLAALPPYLLEQPRGEILQGLGRKSEALNSFAKAVKLADNWRLSALPGDMVSNQTTTTLDRVYRDFVELAADLSLERHDPSLARDALSVLTNSRAANLREQLIAAFQHEMKLPPRYFELLSQLQASESKFLDSSPQKSLPLTPSVLRTRNELAELQTQIGMSQLASPAFRAGTLRRNLIRTVQSNLSSNQLLLSFCLAKKKSFLWTVSTAGLELDELPSEEVLAHHASAYFTALQKGTAEHEGKVMSRDLLSKLSPALAAKKEWLIVADGVLLDQVPFAALPNPNQPETLVVTHSLRMLPTELLLLNPKPPHPASRFVGLADPIYSRADTRLPARGTPGDRPPSFALARLIGSGIEVRAASKLSGVADIQLLVGLDASEAKLRVALAKPPSVLHFAVHVFSAEGGKSHSFADQALALSLLPSGFPELLTKEAITGLRVPGALVVLSGCATQRGEIVPSVGLVGLSRAWLLAGAVAVIETSWPTPDDSGGFFSEFYNRLKALPTGSLGQRASSALQQTQVAMQHRGDYRSSPSFWAAYSLLSSD